MQSKNNEFVALMRTAGWSQAETARRLHVSAAAVEVYGLLGPLFWKEVNPYLDNALKKE